ncbi:hypothetical protein [Arcticibacter sp.]|uniref:hypothetical protein n=1 Tax=Arcticibacter sp. TaxID=1872630 RepID=UPI00388D49CE
MSNPKAFSKNRLLFIVISFCTFSSYAQSNSFPSAGNVGIGSGDPLGRLHVDGPLDGSLSTIRIGNANPGNMYVPSGATTGGYNIDFHTWRDVVPEQIGARIRAERVNSYFGNNALIQSMDLSFFTSDGIDQSRLSEKLRIKSNGDVGIGVSDPKGYKLAVAGSVIAESVTVKMQSVWPDYVFAPGYDLPSLGEVKGFIQQNKHLPGMPSAREVDDSGINLGEMNVKLLKKIEELTLYMINLKEENQALKERVGTLEAFRKER